MSDLIMSANGQLIPKLAPEDFKRAKEIAETIKYIYPAETKAAAAIGGLIMDAVPISKAAKLSYKPAKELKQLNKMIDTTRRASQIPLKQIEREGLDKSIDYSKNLIKALNKELISNEETKEALTKYAKAMEDERMAGVIKKFIENGDKPILEEEYLRLRSSSKAAKAEALEVLKAKGIEPTEEAINDYVTKVVYASDKGKMELPLGYDLDHFVGTNGGKSNPGAYTVDELFKHDSKHPLIEYQISGGAYDREGNELELYNLLLNEKENLQNARFRKRDLQRASDHYLKSANDLETKLKKSKADNIKKIGNTVLSFIPIVGSGVEGYEAYKEIKDAGGLEAYKEQKKQRKEETKDRLNDLLYK